MSAAPTEAPPFVAHITQAHRVATDRATRLAAQHGMVEVAELYDRLSPIERRCVFVMLARAAASPGDLPDADRDPEWWTASELDQAEALYLEGHRTPWLVQAHDVVLRTKRAARRRARANGVEL